MQACLNLHAPLKVKRVKGHSQPKWLTHDIRADMNQRDKLRRLGYHLEYKLARNVVTKKIRQAKQSYYQNAISECKGDSKGLWRTFNSLKGNKLKETTNVLSVEGKTVTDQQEKAEIFSKHYAKISQNIISEQNWPVSQQYVPSDNFMSFSASRLPTGVKFSIPPINVNEVEKE